MKGNTIKINRVQKSIHGEDVLGIDIERWQTLIKYIIEKELTLLTTRIRPFNVCREFVLARSSRNKF